jgi:hypothetical protein
MEWMGEPRDALRHDIIEPTLSVAKPTIAMPTSIPNQAKRSIETPYDTTLTNWHRTSKRWQMIPYIAYMSLVKAQDKTLENRRLSSRRGLKIPCIMTMSLGKLQDKTLAKRRLSSRRGLKIPCIMYMSLGKPQDMTLENRRLSSRWRLKIQYKAYLSRRKAQDKTLAKRHRASQRLSSRSRLKIHDPTEATRHDASKAKPNVAMPTQDAVGSEHEPRKLQNTTLANRCRVSRRVSTRRPTKNSIFVNLTTGKPHVTTLWETDAQHR